MRRARTLTLTVMLACMGGRIAAQTPSPKLAFDTTDPPAQVATYTATLQQNAGTVNPIVLTCTPLGPGSTCTTPLLSPVLKGDVLRLTLTSTGGSAQAAFTDPGVPALPGNIKIVIVISVP